MKLTLHWQLQDEEYESSIELNCLGEGADEIHCSSFIIIGIDVDHNSDFLHIRIVSIQF